MSKPVKNLYYDFISAKLMTTARNLDRSRMLPGMTVCSLFYMHLQLGKESKEDGLKVGKSKVGIGLQDS